MQTIYLSEGTAARRRVIIRLVLASDGSTPATSAAVTAGVCRIIANGADSANTTNNIVEAHATNAPGWWYVELTAGEITTLGVGNHAVRFKETDTFESIGGEFQVVAWDWWAAGVPVLSVAANALTASALATDAVAEIVAAVYAQVVEGSLTMLQKQRLDAAVLYGKSSGGGTVYRDTGDTKDRVTSTVDGSGNRTAITTDAT